MVSNIVKLTLYEGHFYVRSKRDFNATTKLHDIYTTLLYILQLYTLQIVVFINLNDAFTPRVDYTTGGCYTRLIYRFQYG